MNDFTKEELELITMPSENRFTFIDSNQLPFDIICNGFSIKETILEVLLKHEKQRYLDDADVYQIAEEIKELLAVKLHLKQGKIHE